MHSLRLLALATTLSAPAVGQNAAPYAPIPGPVRDAGTFHLATGTWTRAKSTYGLLSQDTIFRNDRASGYFALLEENMEAFDQARLPGAGVPLEPGQPEVGTADSYVITGFQFGYCALDSLNPATATLMFAEGLEPCTDPELGTIDTTLVVSGLPNGGCWIVSVDLTGTTSVFALGSEGGDGIWDNDSDLDSVGWGLNLDHDQGDGLGQLIAGVMLAGDQNLPGDRGNGTVFKNPGSIGTGLGTLDMCWIQGPSIAQGCYFFGGCLPCASYNAAFYGEPDVGQAEPCYGNSNSVAPTGAVLSSSGGFGSATASFQVTDIPSHPGVLFSGPDLFNVPFGCSQRCVGGTGTVRYGPFFPSGNQLNTTIDMSGNNHQHIQYWYRDPANLMTCGYAYNLSNATDG